MLELEWRKGSVLSGIVLNLPNTKLGDTADFRVTSRIVRWNYLVTLSHYDRRAWRGRVLCRFPGRRGAHGFDGANCLDRRSPAGEPRVVPVSEAAAGRSSFFSCARQKSRHIPEKGCCGGWRPGGDPRGRRFRKRYQGDRALCGSCWSRLRRTTLERASSARRDVRAGRQSGSFGRQSYLRNRTGAEHRWKARYGPMVVCNSDREMARSATGRFIS